MLGELKAFPLCALLAAPALGQAGGPPSDTTNDDPPGTPGSSTEATANSASTDPAALLAALVNPGEATDRIMAPVDPAARQPTAAALLPAARPAAPPVPLAKISEARASQVPGGFSPSASPLFRARPPAKAKTSPRRPR